MHAHHVTTSASYGVAAGSFFIGLLNYLTPEQWSAIGVLAGAIIALITMVVDAYFKRANARAYRAWLDSHQGAVSPDDMPEK